MDIFQVNTMEYHVSNHNSTIPGALCDRGANGCLAGGDVMLIETDPNRFVDITGINNAKIDNIPIATVAALATCQHGSVILIIHQAAYIGKSRTILSSAQMEHYWNRVDDCSTRVGGKQAIFTLDDCVLPLHICSGLPFLDLRKPTEDEYLQLPHVILTSDVTWDPSVLDHEHNLLDNTI